MDVTCFEGLLVSKFNFLIDNIIQMKKGLVELQLVQLYKGYLFEGTLLKNPRSYSSMFCTKVGCFTSFKTHPY